MKKNKKKYLNPYVGGILLGLLLILTFYLTGRGLGATGAVKSGVVAAVHAISPEHIAQSEFYSQFYKGGKSPLNNWVLYEILGVLAGAFMSGAFFKRLEWKVEHSPKIKISTRLVFALIGGILFGLGAQLVKGCTSGAALSGSAVLALSGILTMMCIFGSAYALAYFFRKLWI